MFQPISKSRTFKGRPLVLTCPVCGFEYCHVQKVYTIMGSDEYEAGFIEGTQIGGNTAERRSGLGIVVDGECGHKWELVIQQHKGNEFIEYNLMTDEDIP